MPIFSPRPFQPAFSPVEKDQEWGHRVFAALEAGSKSLLFGCRMCGNCLLQETAFVCPMSCAKGLRNGFCGEASEESCVVDPSRPCTWLRIFARAERMGRLDKLLEVQAPIDGAQVGRSAQLELIKAWAARKTPFLPDILFQRGQFWEQWDALCYEVRQPDWWQGDSLYHPAAPHEPLSHLEAALRSGAFVLTGEIEPLTDNDTSRLTKKISLLREFVLAVNYSDNAFAVSRMNSMASSKLSLENGLEPVMQVQGRDRSRNGVLSEVMGASALGIRNILCLGGNYHNNGLRPYPVQPIQFDIDSVQMLWMLRRLRDEGKHIDGREVPVRPQYFLGAAGSPFTLKPAYNALRVEKKINAGAQFLQTQMIFDVDRFQDWMEALDRRSLLGKVYILAGISPLKDAQNTHAMAREKGIYIPPEMIKRMDAACEKDRLSGENRFQEAESVQISVEVIERLKKIPGIHGLHFMVFGQEEVLPRIFAEAGLEPMGR